MRLISILLMLTFLVILKMSFSSAIICNPNLPNGCPQEEVTITSVNNNTLNVNNSQYLNGHPDSYFYPFFNPLNFINSSAQLFNLTNNTFVPYINAINNVDLGFYNISLASLRLMTGGILNFRDDAIVNNTYFSYNNATQRLELWVNGKIQQDWGNSTTIYGEATFQANAFFQNVSGDDVVLSANLVVTKNITGASVYAGNICYSDGTNCTAFNSSSTNITVVGPYLYSITNTIYFNDTVLNNTITSLSQVKAYNYTTIITTSGGSGSAITPNLNGFLITRLTVTPSSNSSQYRFLAVLSGSGDIVDQDRQKHTGIWSIRKNQAVYNDTLNYTITQSNPSVETYNVKVEYINNFNP